MSEFITPMEDTPSKGELIDAMSCVYAGMLTRGLFSGSQSDYWFQIYDSIVEILELAPPEEE